MSPSGADVSPTVGWDTQQGYSRVWPRRPPQAGGARGVHPSAAVAIPLLLSHWCCPPSLWQAPALGLVQPGGFSALLPAPPALAGAPVISFGEGGLCRQLGAPLPILRGPVMDAALLRGHRSHHLGRGKVRVESLPRLDFPWMAAPMPSICPGCCMQTEPLFVPPKKATQASGCLQPLPSPVANSCCHKAGVLGSTCCHHSCRETLISGGCGRVLQAMSDLQNWLRDRGCGLGWGRHCGGWRYRTPGMLSRSQQ